ncbi:hypothetical protein I4U23_011308 [Adineta vaga]|nr:hypothetical protein I4U23_011308 [Adineta vaga]
MWGCGQNTFDIQLNDQPKNGFGSIEPLKGTILTLFTINCTNWFDQDEIKDYLIYGISFKRNKRILLAYSTNSIICLRLPTNVHLIVQIRNTFDCSTEFPLSSIVNNFDMKLLNEHANIREQLMKIVNNFTITTLNDIKYHSSILSILTETTSELTRKTSINTLNKSSQLSNYLKSTENQFSYEDTLFIATQIIQCVTHIHTSLNGPLQKRMEFLQSDLPEINDDNDFYSTDNY